MDDQKLWLDLAASLGLGLLVGLQRERTSSPIAGIRTFPLITLAGTIAASLPEPSNGWAIGAGLFGIVAIAAVGNWSRPQPDRTPGVTTEAAMVLMFLVGALLVLVSRGAGAAVGAACAVLLHAKPVLHRFTQKLDETDVRAIMQFAVISLIILPVAPDKGYGPYGVLNPQKIWLMVVLIVAISLAAYVAYRLLGNRRGALLGGLMGGLISSTATTVSFARQARAHKGSEALAALAILIASSVLCVRLLVILWAVSRQHMALFAGSIGVLFAASLVGALIARLMAGKDSTALPRQSNPTQLKSALVFAGIFCVVLVVAEWGRQRFGEAGTYAVAFIAGLADLDAITLTTGESVAADQLRPFVGARAVVIAFAANAIFKVGIAGVLGGRALMIRLALLSTIPLGAAVALFLALGFWTGQ